MISLDTLRADHMGCYGYARPTSPNLDQLARDGVLFSEMVAASSWTVPSHMSLFTSLYPSAHGVVSVRQKLNPATPTLASVLKENGYLTAAFVSGPALDNAMGFGQGFDSYDDFTVMLPYETNVVGVPDADRLGINQAVTNPTITRLASAWLRKNSDKKFFLFLHYWDIHGDYVPPPPYDRMFTGKYTGAVSGKDIVDHAPGWEKHMAPADLAHLVDLYDGEIAHTDAEVGKVLGVLKELGLTQRTLIVVFSDHGEGFLEHGKLLHGYGLQEELLRVPLILRLPGVIPAGRKAAGAVSHIDVMPTMVRLLSLRSRHPPVFHGMDLSPAIRGDAQIPERVLFSELLKPGPLNLRAVRWQGYKLTGIVDQSGSVVLSRVSDGKDRPVDDKAASEIARFLLPAFEQGPGAVRAGAVQQAVPDPRLIERLKSLGYVQ
jgi:arylsulfatase A-like enzyme